MPATAVRRGSEDAFPTGAARLFLEVTVAGSVLGDVSHQFQVLGAIVTPNMVTVVDLLFGREEPAKHVFHDKAVLHDIAVVRCVRVFRGVGVYVAADLQDPAAAPLWVAFAAVCLVLACGRAESGWLIASAEGFAYFTGPHSE